MLESPGAVHLRSPFLVGRSLPFLLKITTVPYPDANNSSYLVYLFFDYVNHLQMLYNIIFLVHITNFMPLPNGKKAPEVLFTYVFQVCRAAASSLV